MNVVELLQAQAAVRPATAAIIETRGRNNITTFGELDARAARAATLLHNHGVRPGDSILIVHPMSTELYVALAAIFRLGAIAMFIDPSADSRIIDGCCALQPPAAYFSSPLGQLPRLRSAALRRIKLNFSTAGAMPGAIAWRQALTLAPRAEVYVAGADTPALLTFTSGSMGVPKAAVRTHAVLRAQLRALQESMNLTPGSVDITTLPIVLLANLACGITSVICDVDLRRPGRVDGRRVYADARAQRATSATASPAFFERLTSYCARDSLMLPEIQKLFCGGAPVFPKMLDALKRLAPGSDPCAVYGSTEAEPIAHLTLSGISPADRKAMRDGAGLLAGQIVPAVQLRIIRDQWGSPIRPLAKDAFAAECLPMSKPGEIVVSGSHVLPGYLGGRGDEETKFRVENEVWHRTGDLGYLDEQQRLWLLGRCGARIDDAKGTLYPFTVETAASYVAGVRRCAVVAVNGRRLLAVETENTQAEAVMRELQSALGWAHIDELRFLKRIPVDRRHNAKIDYPALRRLLA